MKRTILARAITSREHARKLWPLVTPDIPHQLLTYVSPAFNPDGALLRRSHFRTLPGPRMVDIRKHFDNEEAARAKAAESEEHRLAKDLIADALRSRMRKGLAMPWSFSDPEATDSYLSGNLLLGAKTISTEELVKTAFGSTYRLDVAIKSADIGKHPLLLGGIEIERDHAFDGRKALIAKSQAFPLISVDITGMALADITPQWADRALTETTASASDARRKTFVYLHDILYPLYAQLPHPVLAKTEKNHQFLIFAGSTDLGKLLRWIKALGTALTLAEGKDFSISPVRARSKQSETMLVNAGEVVGPGWEIINPNECLRLTVQRPNSVLDTPSHLFHLTIAKLLLVEVDALVGYKYMNGILNENAAEDVWVHNEWLPESKSFREHRVLPKRLAEPHSQIMELLSSISA